VPSTIYFSTGDVLYSNLLSEGAVVLPAACLLRETQRVTLARFERS
jgi:hypothetical protein